MNTRNGGDNLLARLTKQGISRRQFVKFCGTMAATLALPSRYTERIVHALEHVDKPTLIWLEFQECGGCTETFLRATRPTTEEAVLDLVSLNYHSVIMAAAGHQAEKALWDTVEQEKGNYLVLVEGSIPTKDDGIYATIGGRSAVEIAQEVCSNAFATISIGSCSFYGGWPAAKPNPTGAVGVSRTVPGINLINIPGCPPNAANITATLVHFLTFGELPATDRFKRPLFAFGDTIHGHCERRAHFDTGQFVEEWGDEGHREGWCLYKMGCKGPATRHNCPAMRWNDDTSWPIGAGHGCVGCSEPHFWDQMSPFYRRLPNVPGFGVHTTADQIGLGIAAGTAAAFAAHGVASFVRRHAELRRHKAQNGEESEPANTSEPERDAQATVEQKED